MLVADRYLGHRDDPAVADRLDEEGCLTVTLDATERRRSRVRTTSDDETDLGIVVGRKLRDGDVLAADSRLVVVSLAPIDALVVDFAAVEGSRDVVLAALKLGHAAGNRHWDLAVDGDRALVPLTERRDRMEAEIGPHLPTGATVTTEDVSPALFDDGAQEQSQSHSPDDHSHSHGPHGHSHAHGPDDHSQHHGSDGHSHVRTLDHTHASEQTRGIRDIDPEEES